MNTQEPTYMHHPRRKKKGESLPQLYINREKIKQVDKTKYLGLIVEDSLG